MALTKAEALTRLRERLRDTASNNYAYSDALLYTYLGDALREVGAALRRVDPDYFLSSVVIVAYTDAVADGTYEFYLLPAHASIRKVERYDGSIHYALWPVNPMDQERNRYVGPFAGTVTGDDQTFTVPNLGPYGNESVSIFKDRMRVVPPPQSADGKQWRVWFDAALVVPDGTGETLPIPEMFEKPVIDLARYLALDDAGDPMKAEAQAQAYGVPGTPDIGSLARAVKAQQGRTRREFNIAACG